MDICYSFFYYNVKNSGKGKKSKTIKQEQAGGGKKNECDTIGKASEKGI